MSEEEEVGLQALYRSVRALKGHLTRRISSARKAIRDAGDHPTSESVKELQDYKSKIQLQYEKIEGTYTEILSQVDNDEEYKELETELDKESKRVDEALGEIRTAVGAASAAPREAPNRAPASSGTGS